MATVQTTRPPMPPQSIASDSEIVPEVSLCGTVLVGTRGNRELFLACGKPLPVCFVLHLHLTSVFILFVLHVCPESCLHVPLRSVQPLSVLPPILPFASFLVLTCHLFIRLRTIWSVASLVICTSTRPDDFIFEIILLNV